MRRLILLCLLLMPLCESRAQLRAPTEQYDAYQDCLRSSKDASLEIPALYREQNAPGLDSVIYQWKTRCGSVQPLLYFELVYAIGAGQFDEGLYNSGIIPSLLHFRGELAAAGTAHPGDYGIDSNFYPFVSEAASDLYNEEGARTPVEYWLLRYLSTADTALFAELDNELYNGTVLQESYRDWRIEQPGAKGAVAFNAELQAGAWVPDGGLQRLGTHPLIGAEVGLGSETFSVGVYLNIRFGQAPQPYKVFADSLFSTRYHFGTGLGLNARYAVRKGRRSDVVGLGSIGYDVLTLRPNEEADNQTNTSVSRRSLALGLGAGYRLFLNGQTYIGLEGRYNLLFYRNDGGSDLSGNAFVFTLSIGKSGASSKQVRRP